MKYVIAYDIGTTGVKTCLFEIDKVIKLIGASSKGYNLYILENGGAEQDTEEWWQAMCDTTKDVFDGTAISKNDVSGISFCSQMQGLVVVVEPPTLAEQRQVAVADYVVCQFAVAFVHGPVTEYAVGISVFADGAFAVSGDPITGFVPQHSVVHLGLQRRDTYIEHTPAVVSGHRHINEQVYIRALV